jgi:hypothetical protein
VHHSAVNNGWGRKRRSVDSLEQVYNGDQLGCGMRLVCELSSANFEELENDEKLILGLFGYDSNYHEFGILFKILFVEGTAKHPRTAHYQSSLTLTLPFWERMERMWKFVEKFIVDAPSMLEPFWMD